jgi:hypothetical protein
MNRRHLLAVGGATAALLAVGGTAVAWWRPARRGAVLQAHARLMLQRIAEAVLDQALPADLAPRAAALQSHLERVERTVTGMPPAMQAEVDQLLTLLLSPPGRHLLLGLSADWPDASAAELQQALQVLRTSRVSLRQQVFHALRDLSNAAYFSEPATWPLLGYPGPRPV